MSNKGRLPGLVASAFAVLLPAAAVAGSEATGIATWYGARHDGQRTSSGSVFHQDGMTAASSRLPLGSKVRVTMRDTGDSVVVLVNDRMGGRALIDLSRGAAKQIGLYARGRGMVSVAATDEPIEVAEATEDETNDFAMTTPQSARRGRGSAIRVGARQPSLILARHAMTRHSTHRSI